MVKPWIFWVVGLVMSGVVAVTAVAANAQKARPATPSFSTSAASVATSTPTSVADLSAVAAISTSADFAVEVLNLDTGATALYGGGSYDTASIVKIDILAALLVQVQEEGRSLTGTELSQAKAMIEHSDNASATALFNAVGGEAGLEAFNETIGLDDTDVGADGYWGLTQTTAADQIRLLNVVFGESSVLSRSAQSYVRSLMENVVDSQNFGVSAAADDPDAAALKVGYLQRSSTGLWAVTSIGEIERGGDTYLVAVLSDGNFTFDAGVALVNEVAASAVASLATI